MPVHFGFIGLGKMGFEMSKRLLNANYELCVYDNEQSTRDAAKRLGFNVASSLSELVQTLETPRVIWLQLPPGEVTHEVLESVLELVSPGDIVVDGGNSDFRETKKILKRYTQRHVEFMDVGVSGGVIGARDGAGLLVGASQKNYEALIPVFEILASKDGYVLAGDVGAGHFAKAVHNGVQYALCQAYAEGYAMLEAFGVDTLSVLEAYQAGCSVRSYILESFVRGLKKDPDFDQIDTIVKDSGMGRWTVEESVNLRVPVPTIYTALQTRFATQLNDQRANKSLNIMRAELGGHETKRN